MICDLAYLRFFNKIGQMIRIVYIAIGGAIGAILRYYISGIAYNILGAKFPYGTLSVNVIASILIGLSFELLEDTAISPDVRMLIFVGILGAFSTFSSFSFETVSLFRDGLILSAVWNIILNNVLGISGVILGIFLAKLIFYIGG